MARPLPRSPVSTLRRLQRDREKRSAMNRTTACYLAIFKHGRVSEAKARACGWMPALRRMRKAGVAIRMRGGSWEFPARQMLLDEIITGGPIL
jgi:hypothetical protein